MKKRFLLSFVAFIVLGLIGNLYAQQGVFNNVTDTYLLNASFDDDPSLKLADDLNLKTNTDGSAVLVVPEWTGDSHHFAAGGSFEYGTSALLHNVAGPETDPDGDFFGAALGLQGSWSGRVSYYQEVTLPSGTYKLSYKAYNANDKKLTNSIAGWVTDQDTILSTQTVFPTLTWTADTVTFTVLSETIGKIQVGVRSENIGSGDQPRIFIDALMLWHNEEIASSVHNISHSIASVYPTNTSGNVTVKFANTPGIISVYNISGMEIFTKKAVSVNESINLDGASGIYFIKVQSEGVENVFKIIKRN